MAARTRHAAGTQHENASWFICPYDSSHLVMSTIGRSPVSMMNIRTNNTSSNPISLPLPSCRNSYQFLDLHVSKCRNRYIASQADIGNAVHYHICCYNYDHKLPRPEINWHQERCPQRPYFAPLTDNSASSFNGAIPDVEDFRTNLLDQTTLPETGNTGAYRKDWNMDIEATNNPLIDCSVDELLQKLPTVPLPSFGRRRRFKELDPAALDDELTIKRSKNQGIPMMSD